ncbi:MAG TPA: hypothetical protein PKD90_16495, partial [Phnomibacter sp.]|nr:hypothetical protein [Phnomibacter sp.]
MQKKARLGKPAPPLSGIYKKGGHPMMNWLAGFISASTVNSAAKKGIPDIQKALNPDFAIDILLQSQNAAH